MSLRRYEAVMKAAGLTDYVHVQGLDEVFTKADFIYGPQTGRPGTAGGGVTLPIFSVASTSSVLPRITGTSGTSRRANPASSKRTL